MVINIFVSRVKLLRVVDNAREALPGRQDVSLWPVDGLMEGSDFVNVRRDPDRRRKDPVPPKHGGKSEKRVSINAVRADQRLNGYVAALQFFGKLNRAPANAPGICVDIHQNLRPVVLTEKPKIFRDRRPIVVPAV